MHGTCAFVDCCTVLYSTADKHERMKAIMKYYVEGDEHALEPFPGGSEKGTR